MSSNESNQRRVDALVLGLSGLLLLALAGMLFGVPELLTLTLPLMMTVLMLMGALDRSNRWNRRVLGLVLAFNAVSFALWLVVTLTVSSQAVAFGGLSVAAGVFVYLAWPYYTVVSGPLYAFVLDHIDPVAPARGRAAADVPPDPGRATTTDEEAARG